MNWDSKKHETVLLTWPFFFQIHLKNKFSLSFFVEFKTLGYSHKVFAEVCCFSCIQHLLGAEDLNITSRRKFLELPLLGCALIIT